MRMTRWTLLSSSWCIVDSVSFCRVGWVLLHPLSSDYCYCSCKKSRHTNFWPSLAGLNLPPEREFGRFFSGQLEKVDKLELFGWILTIIFMSIFKMVNTITSIWLTKRIFVLTNCLQWCLKNLVQIVNVHFGIVVYLRVSQSYHLALPLTYWPEHVWVIKVPWEK